MVALWLITNYIAGLWAVSRVVENEDEIENENGLRPGVSEIIHNENRTRDRKKNFTE